MSRHFVDGIPLTLLDFDDSKSGNRISVTLDYLTRDDTTDSIFFEAQFTPGSNLRFKEAELKIQLSRYQAEVPDITLVNIQPRIAHSDSLEIAHTEKAYKEVIIGLPKVCGDGKSGQEKQDSYVEKYSARIDGSRHSGDALWQFKENKKTKGGIKSSLPGEIRFPTIDADQILMCVSVKVKTGVERGRLSNLWKDRPEICESESVVLRIDKQSFKEEAKEEPKEEPKGLKGKSKGLFSKIARFWCC